MKTIRPQKNFSHNNGDTNDEYYSDGIYVGYRYFDTFNVTPNYCFGYGKGYTDFETEVRDVEQMPRTLPLPHP